MRSWFIDIAGLGVSYGHGAALYLYCIDTANYYNFFFCMFANVLALETRRSSRMLSAQRPISDASCLMSLCFQSCSLFRGIDENS